MAKVIKVTPECIEEAKRDFENALRDIKLSDGRITFSKTIGTVDRKATVYFTELAWLKMQTLIREFDKEVAWHGLAYRGDDPEKDEYYIRDILVYPQEVSASTVNTDQEKYQTWLMSQDDDVFNNIRMQGHSHVNMSTSPSSVDTSLYDRILEQLDDTMFYIFLIYNKRGEKTYKIYDMAKNVLFETSDVTVEILDDGTGIEKFLKDAKAQVTTKPYSYTPQYGSGYGGNYGGYGGNYGGYGGNYGNYPKSTPPAHCTQPAKPSTPSTPSVPQLSSAQAKADDGKKTTPSSPSRFGKHGRRKGKRRSGKKGNTIGFVSQSFHMNSYDDVYGDDDDDDEFDSPFYNSGR